jgi:hypothetical protein
VVLLAPPAFCMGMMFPLGLNIWRRHSELLPFFWSANGITSMFASVLGMALSIEFGIATTYALGVGFYVVCAGILVGSRQPNRFGVSAAGQVGGLQLASEDRIASVAASDAPSIQSAQIEAIADNKAVEPSVPPAVHARADEFGR